MTDPLTVVCITGWCRNGSTIIGNILNEIPDFGHVGELAFLWKNSAGQGANNLCGCGQPLTECAIWSRVLAAGRPSGVSAEAHAETVIRRQQACVRTRHTWRVLRRGLHDGDVRAHAELMTTTLHTAAELMGARVLVDTTKIPGESALLPLLDGVAPYYVHLVRDPRAVAQSWSHWKQYAFPMSASRSTAYWHGFNSAARALVRRRPERSMFLRYEDFIADPAGTIDRLLRLCGTDPAVNPMTGGRTIDLHTNHTVTGNPDRFDTGVTIIRDRDDTWRTRLPVRARLAAVTLSWPRFRRYGYSYAGTFRSGRPPAGSTDSAAVSRTESGTDET
ncbi:sulfotransferase [Actinophytocola sp.]|uniref:sulfotransferase n=1 Tax=Actinophytocola sp. TaxID=1872138 RepID=UPI003D6BC8FD